MTTADHYRSVRKKEYPNYAAWLDFIQKLDPDCWMERTGIGVVIMFSDGSRHELGK